MCISDIGIIELECMTFHGYHGCLDIEKIEGNVFTVDFSGELDLQRAAKSDALEDTVDYSRIYDVIKDEMEVRSDLLEHVAGRIVRAIAKKFPEFINFSVRVSKKEPAMNGPVLWSRVTLTYNRQ